MDWNVTARTGRPHIKRYIKERELAVWLVMDASASCRITAPGRTKWDAMHELAALLTLFGDGSAPGRRSCGWVCLSWRIWSRGQSS
ncbi:MAG: DUF58 domain-containing protein [Planctomycetota bacterium]|nr:DUF58 domain-containing protein [Planctomycetota bacterium]